MAAPLALEVTGLALWARVGRLERSRAGLSGVEKLIEGDRLTTAGACPTGARLLGPERPDTLRARANLAVSYWSAGRTDEAIALLEAVAADRARLLGPEHPSTLTARGNLAAWSESRGKVGRG